MFRLDDRVSAGSISEELIKELHQSTILIADISKNNPNVMWEVGYGMALQKPVLFLTQDLSTQPFNIQDMRKIHYDRDSVFNSLHHKLGQAIRDTLGKYEIRRETTSIEISHSNSPKIVAITGTSSGDKPRFERRIRNILKPYLNEKITWLCGSNGLADECILEILIHEKMDIIAVGYHSYKYHHVF